MYNFGNFFRKFHTPTILVIWVNWNFFQLGLEEPTECPLEMQRLFDRSRIIGPFVLSAEY